MVEHDATDSVSRRSVLKTAGGVLAGATAIPGGGGARTEGSLRFEIEAVNEGVIVTRVSDPVGSLFDDYCTPIKCPSDFFLGLAEHYVAHGDENAVSLPDDPGEVHANPAFVVDAGRGLFVIEFHVADIDWSAASGEEVTLGLGFFPDDGPTEHFATESARFVSDGN